MTTPLKCNPLNVYPQCDTYVQTKKTVTAVTLIYKPHFIHRFAFQCIAVHHSQ